MNSDSDKKIRLAIFASGAGSNAENCLRYFQNHDDISIPLIVTNRSDAGVLAVAKKYHVHAEIITNAEWKHPEQGLKLLQQYQIDFILLAGYLALVPQLLINTYRHRIFNTHPALLPDFGGKGMYGKHVHEAVFQSGERETGITVHEVDEVYDEGRILFQVSIDITENDTPATIEQKVRELEYAYLPGFVEKLLLSKA
ncbi:MAG: phosphoribosylglycinamide formyltransferase [Bacteroidetes bacterium]|nr:phosphoribosylglycinamide formyltransferase [Bacteroidota bacterium]